MWEKTRMRICVWVAMATIVLPATVASAGSGAETILVEASGRVVWSDLDGGVPGPSRAPRHTARRSPPDSSP
jgi:hypothetical protein